MRLAQLPPNTWREQSFLQHSDSVTKIALTLSEVPRSLSSHHQPDMDELLRSFVHSPMATAA